MCDFCNELAGRGAGEFERRHPEIDTRTAWASADLAVLPTLGPLARGHLLIVPREHFTAFASMPEPLRRHAEDVVRRFAIRERAEGRDLLWFEHGSAGPASSGGCGIAHAHLHVLPVPRGWNRPALPTSFPFARASGGAWLDAPGPNTDYLLVGQLDNVWVSPVEWLPSQALREWLAPSLGVMRWDWRDSAPDRFLPAEVVALRATLSSVGLAPPVPAA